MEDYIPRVGEAELQHVVEREFAPEIRQKVYDLFRSHIASDWAGHGYRVQLAAMRLARGNIIDLEQELERGMNDFRDVIAPAESPRFWQLGFVGVSKLSSEEREKLIRDDFEEYMAWVKA